ncbi:glutamate 5-kinase [Limosilactobacillus fermentum]
MADKERIVVKIGTSSLIQENGRVNLVSIDRLAFTLACVNNQGYQPILVSSGAIGVGLASLGLTKRPAEIARQQALASIGQTELMRIYSQRFLDYQTKVGQILITRDVLTFPVSLQHVIDTFEVLLADKVIPIVNENDPVAVDELDHHTMFSDNDELSAQVAVKVGASKLIVLSDIDAFYDADPHQDPDAKVIRHVEQLTPEMEAAAGGSGSGLGTGGMVTKLRAAKTMLAAGKQMILCNGKDPAIIKDVLAGKEIGTRFGKGN